MVVLSVMVLFFGFMNTYYADTATASVTVGNSAPVISSVTFTAAGMDNVTAHSYDRYVMCNAAFTDANGYTDVSVDGTFGMNLTHSTSTNTSAADTDVQYNMDCTVVSGSGTSATLHCRTLVNYFADQGSWYCHAHISDGAGDASYEASAADTFNTILAIQANETTVNFGSIGAGSNYTTNPGVALTITNLGNEDLGIKINGTDLTSGGDTIIAENITYMLTTYNSPTQKGSGSNDPDSNPRQLESAAYTWTSPENWLDRESGDANFMSPAEVIRFRMTVPAGSPTGTYTGTIVVAAANA